ncbi:MAG: histidinol-phosphate aminotransferase family protein [Chloroflexi bacterium]|nr:MAG: histidinol-phosphate aminotransferase family protein [Chloroflexota bacterium]
MTNHIPTRPELSNLPPVHHGAFDYGELEALEIAPDDVLDFSVNSNPYGPSTAVSKALKTVPLERYPDRETLALRRALSAHLNRPLSHILAGSGTAELLWLLALAYVRAGDRALILQPTFGEYENVVQLMGGIVEGITAVSTDQFAHQTDIITKQLKQTNYRLLFICNPNNPTGQALPLAQIEAWAVALPNTLIVVDEAYIAFAPDVETAVSFTHPNLLILRSMTKDYAIAGLRLGYAVGHPEVIEALKRVQPPWSVNGVAQAAGVAALADIDFLQNSLPKLWRDKQILTDGLMAAGYAPTPSTTHYFLLPVSNAAQFRQKLLQHRLQVRDCTSFGLPNYVRIATRKGEENGRLVEAMKVLSAED